MVCTICIEEQNKSISINENFAAEVEYRRILLYPILKYAKQSRRFEGKAFTNGDTLVLNNQSYSVEDLHKLPHDVHFSNLSKHFVPNHYTDIH